MVTREFILQLISEGMVDDACESRTFCDAIVQTFEQENNCKVEDIQFSHGLLRVDVLDNDGVLHQSNWRVTVEEFNA